MSVVPALWPGERLTDIELTTRMANEAGCQAVWFSEVNGYDAVALASGLAARGYMRNLTVVLGPLPLPVRDPALMAQGISTIYAFTAGDVELVLGASSKVIVEQWHGRSSADPVGSMDEYVAVVKDAVSEMKTESEGRHWSSQGFELAVPAPWRLPVGIAALGDRMLDLAGRVADRVVLNLVPPDLVPLLKEKVERSAVRAGRAVPPITVWLPGGSESASLDRVASLLRGYVAAPGYRTRLEQSGLLDQITDDPKRAVHALAAFGLDAIDKRCREFRDAGVDEVALVMSSRDPIATEIIRYVAANQEEPWS